MKICIAGGGNLGTALAADFAAKNHAVNVLTSRPDAWTKTLVASDMTHRGGAGKDLT